MIFRRASRSFVRISSRSIATIFGSLTWLELRPCSGMYMP